MKGISLATGALAFAIVNAFPHLMTSPDSPLVKSAFAKRQAVNSDSGAPLPLIPPPFNAAQQHVSTTGQYAFVAPRAGDARGECPGLNAMANHGYLPHNGVATVQQFVTGTYQVFGMNTVKPDVPVSSSSNYLTFLRIFLPFLPFTVPWLTGLGLAGPSRGFLTLALPGLTTTMNATARR